MQDTVTTGVCGSISERTLNWARNHDWGVDAYLFEGVIGGLYDSLTDDDVCFDNRADLREWAGY